MRHLKIQKCLEMSALLRCCQQVVCIQRLDDIQDPPSDTKLPQHLPQYSTWYNIERFLEVDKITKQLASFPFQSGLPLFVNQ